MIRAILVVLIEGFVYVVTSYGDAPPTRADLLKTVQHIQALAKEQQTALDNEKAAHKAVETALVNATNSVAILQKQVQEQTDKLNATQDKLDATAKKLWWYRIHFFLGWIILATGLIACGVWAFLKFTGRLAVAAAPVVAKVP